MKIKHIIQSITIVLVILFFVPAFGISCSGQHLDLSMSRLTAGIKLNGETIQNPLPFLAIFFIMPAVLFVIWFIKNGKEKRMAALTVVFSIIQIILWILVSAGVKKEAEEYYCSFETLAGYKWAIVLNIVLIVIGLLIVGGVSANKKISEFAKSSDSSGEGGSSVTGNKTMPDRQVRTSMGTSELKFCPMCGVRVSNEDKYCPNCGCKLK